MNGRIDSGLGQIVIDTDVIPTYAGSVAVECFGIVGMAAVSMKDGLVKLLRMESLKHGISVKITEDNKIRLNFHVIVAYGVNISTIADNLVSNVKYKVEDFTGMEIDKINIYVEGVRAIEHIKRCSKFCCFFELVCLHFHQLHSSARYLRSILPFLLRGILSIFRIFA